MIKNAIRLKYALSYVVLIMLFSSITIFLAKYLMPHRIYLFWLLVGGPTMVCGAVLAVRKRIRAIDPEWGYPVARVFTLSLFIYSLVAVALPFVEAQLPNTVTALFRREQQADIDLAGGLDPSMLEAQKTLITYGNEYRNAEAEQLSAGFKKLAQKRRDGTFGPEDQAKEQELLSRYTALSKKLTELKAIAKGQTEQDANSMVAPSGPGATPPSDLHTVIDSVKEANHPEINPYLRLVHLSSSSGHQIAIATESPSDADWMDTFKAQLRFADSRVQPDAFDSTELNSNGLFNKIYDGDLVPLERSGALSHFQYVVLMRVHQQCGPSTVSGVQLISCSLQMQAKAYDHSGQVLVNTTASSAGAGFSEAEALDIAAKRLADTAKTSLFVPLRN